MQISPERLELTRQLYALVIDYWHDVDTNWGKTAPDYYTEDAEFIGSRHTYKGRETIRKFYNWREDRGDRTVVHSVLNFRAMFDGGPDKALCHWFLYLQGADGRPVLPTHPPITVSYTTDRLVRTDAGWKVNSRKFDTWFKGELETTNPDLTSR